MKMKFAVRDVLWWNFLRYVKKDNDICHAELATLAPGPPKTTLIMEAAWRSIEQPIAEDPKYFSRGSLVNDWH